MTAAGIADSLIGIDQLLVTHLTRDAKFGCQIGTANQQHVDTIDRGDRIGVADSFLALDHHRCQDFSVDRRLRVTHIGRLV